MRWQRPLVAMLGLMGALLAHAQTCAVPGRDGSTASAGTVNTYYTPASGTYTSGSTAIALGASRGAATAVAPGDLVIVMQMQCATIDTSNTSNYGGANGTGRGYTDPASNCLAGRYQYVRAGAATTSSQLDLSGSPLAATYVQDPTASNRRTFQILRVPQHASLTLTGTVNAPYWDGSTGGVVALDVAGALNWNGQTIDVSGRGFRGGAAVRWNGTSDINTPPDWVATLASDQHATKGEGIAGTPRWVLNQESGLRQDNGLTWAGYANGDQGRGAPGNAGGGGDNRSGTRDNGGGGGGGNGGIGGFGGYGWKSGGWGGIFTAGDFDLRGIGGAAFAAPAPNRVVLGGGGGAGGSNNAAVLDDPVDSSGGAGGGVVIVRAGSMSGSGSVNASGANGRTQPREDGAGGGGAGGSVVLMSAAGGLGSVAVNVAGGAGGNSYLTGTTAHAGGGGGAGGIVILSGAVTANVAGAANGTTNTGDAPVGGASHGATPGGSGSSAQSTDSSFTTRPSAQCLPNLTVTKRTLTPTVTTASATSVSYTIVVSNSGGAATGADLVDNTLPPGWTFAQTSGLSFAPALSASAWGGFVEGATPGQPAVAGNPGTVANLSVNGSPNTAPVWGNLTIPGITNGTAGVVTLSFVVNVPATAPVGCFHNPAGVKYLDPTRSTAGREVAPAANNTANRAGALVGGTANTSYETAPGTSSTVAGSHHSGLVDGPTVDDVCLQGDLSVSKSAPASTTAGQTISYTLTARNNGRAIRDLSYSADQATPATNTTPASRVLANGTVRVTDTLPTGLSLTSAVTSPGWSCALSGQTLTCDSSTALPLAAATSLPPITATVRVGSAACAGPVTNTATVAGFQAPHADSSSTNDSGTATTSLNCNASLGVSKTNGTSTVVVGTTTTYTVSFVNSGPSSAEGAVLTDVPGAGLGSCTVLSCSAAGGSPFATSCPAAPANLLSPSGVVASSFPAGGTLDFQVQCTVTASGS